MLRLFQFVVLMLTLSVVALISAIVTMRFAIHGAEVKVPNLKGLTVDEAREKTAETGVELSIEARIFSAEIPVGRIVSQSPTPASVVRREWHIRATESLGPQMVAIPNFIGLQERAATMQIFRLRLEPGSVAHLPSSTSPPETVIAQDPQMGAAGVERPIVSLVVADGRNVETTECVMPDFIGQQVSTAAAAVSRSGLKLGKISYTPLFTTFDAVSTPRPGMVLNQSPQRGYLVGANTAIELTVGR